MSADLEHAIYSTARAPSRHDNPFATCWTRPSAIPFDFPPGISAETIVARLASNSWRGAIVGPHGSGKSTLLLALQPALIAAGRTLIPTCLHDGQRNLERGFPKLAGLASPLVIVDGYEQLSWFSRRKLAYRCRRAGAGLLVTTHGKTSLPTLFEMSPNRALIERLCAKLTSQVSTPITILDVAASLDCHGSNVRELFFDLYSKHERLRRAARTAAVAST